MAFTEESFCYSHFLLIFSFLLHLLCLLLLQLPGDAFTDKDLSVLIFMTPQKVAAFNLQNW